MGAEGEVDDFFQVEDIPDFEQPGEQGGMAMLVGQKSMYDQKANMAEEMKNMTEEEKAEFNQKAMDRLHMAEEKLAAKKEKEGPIGPLEVMDAHSAEEAGMGKIRSDQIMVNGQAETVARPDRMRREIAKLQSLPVSEVQLNLMKLNLLKVLKKSQWAHKFKRVEINEDPLKRWTQPIVRVTVPMRFQYALRSMVRMNNYVTRCKVLNPDNEDAIDAVRIQIEEKMFRLRQLTETEEDFDPIFEVTKRGLKKTQERLDGLLAGMGGDDSEASVSSDCREDAMDVLKATRKQMMYTMASVM